MAVSASFTFFLLLFIGNILLSTVSGARIIREDTSSGKKQGKTAKRSKVRIIKCPQLYPTKSLSEALKDNPNEELVPLKKIEPALKLFPGPRRASNRDKSAMPKAKPPASTSTKTKKGKKSMRGKERGSTPDKPFVSSEKVGDERSRSSSTSPKQSSTQVPTIPPCTSSPIAGASPSPAKVQSQKVLRHKSPEQLETPDLRKACFVEQDRQECSSSRQGSSRESRLGSDRPVEAPKIDLSTEDVLQQASSKPTGHPEDIPKLSLYARPIYSRPIHRQTASKLTAKSIQKTKPRSKEPESSSLSLANLYIVIDCDDPKEEHPVLHPLGLTEKDSPKSESSEEMDYQSSRGQLCSLSSSRSNRSSCKKRLLSSSESSSASPQLLPMPMSPSSSESPGSSGTAKAAQEPGLEAALFEKMVSGLSCDSTGRVESFDDTLLPLHSGEEVASRHDSDCDSPFVVPSGKSSQKERTFGSGVRKDRSCGASTRDTASFLARPSSPTYPGFFASSTASKGRHAGRLQRESTPLNSPVSEMSSQRFLSFPLPASESAPPPKFNPYLSVEKIKKLESGKAAALRLLQQQRQHSSPNPLKECVLVGWTSIKNVPKAPHDDPDAPFIFHLKEDDVQSTGSSSYLIHRSWDTQKLRVYHCDEFYGKTTKEVRGILARKARRKEKLRQPPSTHSSLASGNVPTLLSSSFIRPRSRPRPSRASAKGVLQALCRWMGTFPSIADGTEQFFVQNFFAKQHVTLSLRTLVEEDGSSVEGSKSLSRFTIVDEVSYERQSDGALTHFPHPCILLPSETGQSFLVYMYVSENLSDGKPYIA